MAEPVAHVALPGLRMTLGVHPQAHPDQHHGGEQRTEAFRQLPARAADGDHPGGQCPGHHAGRQRGQPATVDPGQHLGAAGLAQQRDHGDDDQQCFEALAQQDGEGRHEAGGGRGAVLSQHLLGLREQAVEFVDLGLQRGRIGAAGEARAQPRHGGLDLHHQRLVAGREQRFDRLEAVQVGRQGEVAGALRIACAMGRHRLAQQAARHRQRRSRILRLGLRRFRMPAQVSHDLRGRVGRAQLRGELRGRGADVALEVELRAQRRIGLQPRPARLRQRGGIRDRAAVGGQRPEILAGQPPIAGHRGAFQALFDDLVEREHAALVGARAIGEIDRRRIQAGAGRAVAGPGGAVAARAQLRVQRLAARVMRRTGRHQRDRVGLHQQRGQATRLQRDSLRLGLVLDGLPQCGGIALQLRGLRRGRQRVDRRGGGRRELQHLVVFERVDHFAAGHRLAIVHRDVVEQPPGGGDAAFGGGSGNTGADQGNTEQQRCQQATWGHGRI